jgi:hypothetical protein
MLESRSFRFTPARLVLFLLTPAVLLGGTFAVAQRSLVVGLVALALGALTIAVNLGVGALMTELGMALEKLIRRQSPSRRRADGGPSGQGLAGRGHDGLE